MEATELSETTVTFRLRRAEEFTRQWRSNAKRLQTLASDPHAAEIVRSDALGEARSAADIVARRVAELAELARQRGYTSWEADPRIGPIVVEIRAVENALTYAVEALSKT